jgi:hypothetical protein
MLQTDQYYTLCIVQRTLYVFMPLCSTRNIRVLFYLLPPLRVSTVVLLLLSLALRLSRPFSARYRFLLLSFSPKLAEPKFAKKINDVQQNTFYLAEYQLKSHRFKTICETEVLGTKLQYSECFPTKAQ